MENLETAEKIKETKKQKKLKTKYDDWSYHFNLLKEQFRKVWNLFGTIEESVPSWYRATDSYHQWAFMGASGYGYNFGASIHYLGSEPLCVVRSSRMMGGSKKLVLSYGCEFSKRAANGVGDERDIGRTTELDDKLVGLENCDGRTLDRQLSGVDYMLNKLHESVLIIKISGPGNNGYREVPIAGLYDIDLEDACKKMFMALNQDDIIELSQYLPDST